MTIAAFAQTDYIAAQSTSTSDSTDAATRGVGPSRITAPAQLEPLHVHRIQQPIELDGRLDDPGWREVEPILATMQVPDPGREPTERTEFLLAYDDDHLYVGARLHMADTSRIQATTLKRDQGAASNDFLIVLLDCFRDRENGLAFATNPAGIRWDAQIPNDAAPLRQLTSWNTFWDVEVSRNGDGWFAEMRIPFSSLRFQEEDGRVVMGLTVFRWIASKTEADSYPAVPDTWGMNGLWKASQTRPIVLEGIRARQTVYLTPYALGGRSGESALNTSGLAYDRDWHTAREVGLDVKYGITGNLTLDLTLNPDFAQVEADNEQVNLTRFSLFFPEKRLFFQERASVFEFGLGGTSRLFYSRRMGLDAGRAVRILGGARMVGRVGDWDVGLLDVQTQRTEFTDAGGAVDLVPTENLGVLRLRRRVLNEASYVGGLMTSRMGPAGTYDVTLGADAIVRTFGQNYLTLQVAGRSADDTALPQTKLDRASLVRLLWERRGTVGWLYALEAERAGPDFRPSLGFLPRTDYSMVSAMGGRGWRGKPGSSLLEASASMVGGAYVRNGGRGVESAWLGPSFYLATRDGHQLWGDLRLLEEDLQSNLHLPESTWVAPGRYRFPRATFTYWTPWGNRFRPGVWFSAGGYYDGRIVSASVTPTWRPSAKWEVGGYYRLNRVSFPDRGQGFTTHLARFRVGVTPNVKLSCFGLVQYNSASDVMVANLRLRVNPREGNDLYVVYNHILDVDREGLDPVPPLTRVGTFLIKYSHTLAFQRR